MPRWPLNAMISIKLMPALLNEIIIVAHIQWLVDSTGKNFVFFSEILVIEFAFSEILVVILPWDVYTEGLVCHTILDLIGLIYRSLFGSVWRATHGVPKSHMWLVSHGLAIPGIHSRTFIPSEARMHLT